MKALTFWQPWASLVVGLAKPFEFRSWRPPQSIIGQRIVIHASARKPDIREVERLLRLLKGKPRGAAATCLTPINRAIDILERGDWPLAAGLGSAVVGVPRPGDELAIDFGVLKANDSTRDYHANWGWPMLNVEFWPEPLPMRGAQGLWNWPKPEDILA